MAARCTVAGSVACRATIDRAAAATPAGSPGARDAASSRCRATSRARRCAVVTCWRARVITFRSATRAARRPAGMMPFPGAQEVGMRHQFTTTRAVCRPRRGHPSDAGLDLAGETYRGLVTVVSGLDDEQGWAPTDCAGWCVRDLVAHLLDDVRRGLVALGTPAGGPPDTDRIRYWATWRPGSDV